MKKLMAVLLASFSANAFADSVLFDSTFCSSSPKEHGVCMQNQTNTDLKDKFSFAQESYFKDGTASVWQTVVTDFHAGNYIDISFTDEYLKQHHITMVDFTLLRNNIPVPGCTYTYKPALYPNKPVLRVLYEHEKYFCQLA